MSLAYRGVLSTPPTLLFNFHPPVIITISIIYFNNWTLADMEGGGGICFLCLDNNAILRGIVNEKIKYL